MTTKKRSELTLADRLSRLTFDQACKLLGPRAQQLIFEGGKLEVVDFESQVSLDAAALTVSLPNATVSLRPDKRCRGGLRVSCTSCDRPCHHQGLLLSLVLEEKLTLGLAAPPEETLPLELLDEKQLVARALAERTERASKEKMQLRSTDAQTLWTDYTITSATSGKSYRLALRGWQRGESYCSCPDFRKNTLGTCKHILHALGKLRRRFGARARRQLYERTGISVTVRYGDELALSLLAPQAKLERRAERMVAPYRDKPVEDVAELLRAVHRLERLGHVVTIYPDAEELIQKRLFERQIARLVAEIRADPTHHPLRRTLLQAELLPYQLDGIAFAVGAGRAVLADDMGLGKTIQGIGVAEILAREAGITRVLVICPASLKGQWRGEIERFCRRDAQLVVGSASQRAAQYDNGAFFTICNYEQVLRDVLAIERTRWDLIILDEGQRIKNWEAKTTRMVGALRSRFALVLSGTPMENNLGELYSVVSFIDDRRLGPAFRFFNRHREVDETGRVVGFRRLDELRELLAPVLLRRTRESVLSQLPARHTEIVRIPATDEQLEVHGGQMRVVSSIVNKRYISEMDLLRLRKALLMCRLIADSTFLFDKHPPGYSTKLEQLDLLLAQLAAEPQRKAIIFSEWTTMLDLIEPLCAKHKIDLARLDGKVPQKKRQLLVARFRDDPRCRAFLTTNAGSTGLNLQAADTVINVDLPWNPAVLEQRIARAHRMGQKRPVQVYVLVTEGTIEENLLGTLSAKHALSLAVLDSESEIDSVELHSSMEELKRRLEVLLGAKPEAELDVSERDRVQRAQSVRMAAASGRLLSAALGFVGELLPETAGDDAQARQLTARIRQSLDGCLERDDEGGYKLSVTLPDASAITGLAHTLGRLLNAALSAETT